MLVIEKREAVKQNTKEIKDEIIIQEEIIQEKIETNKNYLQFYEHLFDGLLIPIKKIVYYYYITHTLHF